MADSPWGTTPNGIATDSAGNVYLAGKFRGSLTLCTNSPSLSGIDSQFFVAKLDSAGNCLWLQAGAVTGSSPIFGYSGALELGQSVAVDPQGACYLAGTFNGRIDFGTTNFSSISSNVWATFIAKYSPGGTVAWAIKIGDFGGYNSGIAAGDDGSVHVVGLFDGTVPFGSTNLLSAGQADMFHAKYDTSGKLIWVRTAGGMDSEAGDAVAVDSQGNSFMAGFFQGPVRFGSTVLNGHPLNGVGGYFIGSPCVVKYDPAGNIVWAAQLSDGLDAGVANAVSTDTAGNCYVTGWLFALSSAVVTATNARIFVAKYDAPGNHLWTRQVGGGSPGDQEQAGLGVATDTKGHCYVIGTYNGSADFGITNLVSPGVRDSFIAKYDPQGQLAWAVSLAQVAVNEGSAIALAADGSVYAAAYFCSAAFNRPCNIWNGTGPTTSIAKLTSTFAGPPAITIQPLSQNAIAGTDVKFGVTATGTAPLRYQWQFNGRNFTAATNTMLVISNAQPRNAGDYTVVVANDYGSVTSAVATLTVNFTLTVSVNGTGTVTRSPDLANYPPNSVVTLTAVPTAGYAFDSWSGDASGRRNPLAVTMSSNLTITANFVSTALAITVQGPGSVTKSPDEPFYNVGDQVTLTATTSARWYAFNHWGDGGTNNPRLIFIGANNNYTAIFSPTTAVETLTFGSVSRTAPVGMPAIFVDGNFEVTNSVTRQGRAQITMQTSFPNGTIFYTLDGSPPTFVANLYAGPFELRRSATIRAAAWNAFFSRFWEADTLTVVIQPVYSLTSLTPGGGSIVLSPTNGPYLSNTIVMLSATPASGWSFLQWLGDASGTNPITRVVMTRDKCVEAVFGTTLNTVVAGNGSVALNPNTALYPYGTAVTLTAVPQAGNFFGVWGDAVSSTNNPLRFVVTNGKRTISAAFAPLDVGQFALTVMTSGSGQAAVNPHANRYSSGQGVTLKAAPDVGQDFLGWSGDGTGTLTNLFVVMDQSRVVTANFTRRPRLSLGPCLGGLSEDGFQLTLNGEYGARYEIDGSTTLTDWTALATVTNLFGTVQFRDQTGTNSPYRFYRAILLP